MGDTITCDEVVIQQNHPTKGWYVISKATSVFCAQGIIHTMYREREKLGYSYKNDLRILVNGKEV